MTRTLKMKPMHAHINAHTVKACVLFLSCDLCFCTVLCVTEVFLTGHAYQLQDASGFNCSKELTMLWERKSSPIAAVLFLGWHNRILFFFLQHDDGEFDHIHNSPQNKTKSSKSIHQSDLHSGYLSWCIYQAIIYRNLVCAIQTFITCIYTHSAFTRMRDNVCCNGLHHCSFHIRCGIAGSLLHRWQFHAHNTHTQRKKLTWWTNRATAFLKRPKTHSDDVVIICWETVVIMDRASKESSSCTSQGSDFEDWCWANIRWSVA